MIYTTFRLLSFNSSPSSILSAAARSYYTSVKASTVTTAIPILSPGGIVEKTARRTKFKMANQSNSEQKSVLRCVINSPKAPAAIGPYSPAILANETLYISGQLGIDASKGELVPGGVEKEAEQALINLGYILHAANADYKNVVKTTVLLADINDFQTVNQIYAKFFTNNPPARAAYQVVALPKQARVEIEAIAIIGELRSE